MAGSDDIPFFFSGGIGNDFLIGGWKNDTLNGEGGDDQLSGGNGQDLIDGGAGSDIASYSDKTDGIHVILNSSTDVIVKVGGVNEDTIKNIENITGGTGNDSIYGDSLQNFIDGNSGNDSLKGFGGDDSINGGTGVDTVDYQEKTSPVSVTLNGSSWVAVYIGGVIEDYLINIENVVGGMSDDYIIGDIYDNNFQGRAGKDTLDGGAGEDTADYRYQSASISAYLDKSNWSTITLGGIAKDSIRNIENIIGK
jgi:Ca2+-binding RTX toxin-like protein